jgi:hypothetical protein
MRSAWCYGDPGVAVALYSAARELADPDMARAALALARRSAALAPEVAIVEDTCVCHGSAGLGHLYNRLFQATGDEILREASLHWFRLALDSRRKGRGAAGFLFLGPKLSPGTRLRACADRSFLNGTIGVAHALVSACSDKPPVWDRILLLDLSRLKALPVVR